MATDVHIPEISEGVTEGTVITLLIAVGDTVEQDQSLLELETDKAVVAIPSPLAGKVISLEVNEGETVAVGAIIARIEGETTSGDAPAATEPEAEVVTEAETAPEPATEAEPPPTADPEPLTSELPASEPIPTTAPEPAAAAAPAAPSVRRLARELGVPIDSVPGTGPHGRISAADVQAFVKNVLTGKVSGLTSPAGAGVSAELPDFTRWGPVEREPLKKVREITAAIMTSAWQTIPQVTQYDKADITALEEFRQTYNAKRSEDSAKLTMTAILLKVAAVALQEFPQFNASLDWARRELVLKHYIHIGVAVDTPHGLLVPVVQNVDGKGIADLATELTDLAARTRERKVKPDELEGGNFTISNLGGIGGTAFSPIVYPPQVAILGVSRASTEAVWRDGQFQPSLIMPLSLTYDHRVIDGADGARFLGWICAALAQPLWLAMKGTTK